MRRDMEPDSEAAYLAWCRENRFDPEDVATAVEYEAAYSESLVTKDTDNEEQP